MPMLTLSSPDFPCGGDSKDFISKGRSKISIAQEPVNVFCFVCNSYSEDCVCKGHREDFLCKGQSQDSLRTGHSKDSL